MRCHLIAPDSANTEAAPGNDSVEPDTANHGNGVVI